MFQTVVVLTFCTWIPAVPQDENTYNDKCQVRNLIIIPQSLQKQFLSIAYEASGHQGYDCTYSILSDSA